MSKATRQAFGESLAAWGEKRKDIVVLDADLAKSTKSELFMKKFPERFFEMGISEANMIGVASGLAFQGKLPFLCSFGAFLTGRYDTIRLSVAYAGANVRLIGTHAGVGIGDDGHSQMGLEDVALMRALPTMGVFQPADEIETALIMDHLVEKWSGPAYLRLTRQSLPIYTDKANWRAEKIHHVRKPSNPNAPVVLLGSGAGTQEAMKAAEILESKGIAASVFNAHCLKPYDTKGTIDAIANAKLVVSVEDHSVIGGLGACIEETLAANGSGKKLMKIGVQDLFGESGEPDELFDKFGISGKIVAESVARALK